MFFSVENINFENEYDALPNFFTTKNYKMLKKTTFK